MLALTVASIFELLARPKVDDRIRAATAALMEIIVKWGFGCVVLNI